MNRKVQTRKGKKGKSKRTPRKEATRKQYDFGNSYQINPPEMLKFGKPRKPQNRKEEVIKRLCHLAAEVREVLGGAADCFCCESKIPEELATGPLSYYRFDEENLNFITESVLKALIEVLKQRKEQL